jgi:hypothetical protein
MRNQRALIWTVCPKSGQDVWVYRSNAHPVSCFSRAYRKVSRQQITARFSGMELARAGASLALARQFNPYELRFKQPVFHIVFVCSCPQNSRMKPSLLFYGALYVLHVGWIF